MWSRWRALCEMQRCCSLQLQASIDVTLSASRDLYLMFRAALASVTDLRIAYSSTFGYARPDPEVVKLTDKAVITFEELGCTVDLVENVFDADPADLWTAEFYAGVGIRLRLFMENQRELLDRAVDIMCVSSKLDLVSRIVTSPAQNVSTHHDSCRWLTPSITSPNGGAITTTSDSIRCSAT